MGYPCADRTEEAAHNLLLFIDAHKKKVANFFLLFANFILEKIINSLSSSDRDNGQKSVGSFLFQDKKTFSDE